MRRFWILFLGMVFLATLIVGGCALPKTEKKETKEHKTSAVSKATKKEIIKDAHEDVKIIQEVQADVTPFKKVLTGQAMKDMTNAVKRDLSEGKIKIRRYDYVKITFKNYNQSVAGVTLEFLDRSYYIDKNTKKTVGPPIGARKHLALALIKEEGRWKISRIFSATEK